MSKGDLAKAVAEAVTETVEGSTKESSAEGTAAPEAPEAKTEGTKETPASQEVGTEVETAEREDYDAFKAQYGVDLSVLPDDDSRDKFVREFRETNKTINKLQRENAELKTQPPVVEPPAPVAPEPIDTTQLTDEQIAQALFGPQFDLNEADDRDIREIGLTRTMLEAQAKLERLEAGFQESTQKTTWREELAGLEGKFGVLPDDITRDDVIAYARQQGISSPEAAYWAAVGPVRAAVNEALNTQLVQLRTATKKGATTIRPGTAAETEEKLQATNVKDGIREAFEAAKAKLGIEFTE